MWRCISCLHRKRPLLLFTAIGTTVGSLTLFQSFYTKEPHRPLLDRADNDMMDAPDEELISWLQQHQVRVLEQDQDELDQIYWAMYDAACVKFTDSVQRVSLELKWWQKWRFHLHCIGRALYLFVVMFPSLITFPILRWNQFQTFLQLFRSSSNDPFSLHSTTASLTDSPGVVEPSWRDILWQKIFHWSLSKGGACAIKLGQWLATRPDLVDPCMSKELTALHHSAPSHSFQDSLYTLQTLDVLQDENMRLDNNSLSREPIGTGAVAQVHTATLNCEPSHHLNHDRVAIKVLHPGVSRRMAVDLTLLLHAASWMETLIPSTIWYTWPLHILQFGSMMRRQLDLRREAAALVSFRQLFHDETSSVIFPRPWFASRRILVESYEDGMTLDQFYTASHEKDTFLASQRRPIADLGIHVLYSMIFRFNLTHADLHPGNMLVRFRPTLPRDCWYETLSQRVLQRHWSLLYDEMLFDCDSLSWIEEKTWFGASPPPDDFRPQLVLLDCGLVTRLAPPQWKDLRDLAVALVADRDGRTVAQLLMERAPPVPLCIQQRIAAKADQTRQHMGVLLPQVFCERLGDLVASVLDWRAQVCARLDVTAVLRQVMNLVREHHVRLDDRFVNLVVAIVVLDGLGRQLAPELDVLDAAVPFVVGRTVSLLRRWLVLKPQKWWHRVFRKRPRKTMENIG